MKRFLLQQLDQETLNRIDHQNQVQTLLEEIDFIRRVNDQEIKELQAMAARDTTNENREFFRNELASAIRDIRAEYDQVNSYAEHPTSRISMKNVEHKRIFVLHLFQWIYKFQRY